MMNIVLGVAGGILLASVIWTAIIIALFKSKRVRKWMMDLGMEYSKEMLVELEKIEEL